MTGRTADETTFDELATEARDPSAADLDLQSTIELVRRMNAEDAGVPAVWIEGFEPHGDGSARDLIRPPTSDLFR